MKFVFGLFLSIQMCAYAFFPAIENKSDIKLFFPKSKDEIQSLKQDVIANFMKSIDEILSDQSSSGKEIIQNWDKALGQIKVYSELLTALSMVMPLKELRQACQNAAIEIDNNINRKIMQSQALYDKLNSAKSDKNLNKEDLRYLNSILDYFKSLGLNLNETERNKIIGISSELNELCALFQSNIMEDTSYFLATKSDLEGLSDEFIASLNKNEEGYYIISCDYPTVFPALSKCKSSDVRKAILNVFYNRAHPGNTQLLERIIAKRAEKARILNYKSFADFQLSQMLIKSVPNAEDFLFSLLKKIADKEKKEFVALKEIATKDFEFSSDGAIFPADIYYLWDKYRMEKHLLDSDKISEYFSLNTLMERTIPFLEAFYNVEIKLSKTKDLWIDDLTILEIKKNNTQLGYIVLDFFPRKGKYSHACMCPIIPSYKGADGKSFPALNIVITNFPIPTNEKPALLSIKEVRTLYHELGHAFHDILGETNYIFTAGTGVPVDFVEMPSQLMEEWLFEKGHLKEISCHFQDNTQLDDEILMRIFKSRKDDIATILQRQIFLSLLSLEYFKEGYERDTSAVYKELYELCHPNYIFCPDYHFQASFGHLDGYGASYYGYLWSKVIAIDIFESFKEGDVIQHSRIQEYVDQILSKGDSVDLIQAVESYLGRKINLDSFLKRLSINDM